MKFASRCSLPNLESAADDIWVWWITLGGDWVKIGNDSLSLTGTLIMPGHGSLTFDWGRWYLAAIQWRLTMIRWCLIGGLWRESGVDPLHPLKLPSCRVDARIHGEDCFWTVADFSITTFASLFGARQINDRSNFWGLIYLNNISVKCR